MALGFELVRKTALLEMRLAQGMIAKHVMDEVERKLATANYMCNRQ